MSTDLLKQLNSLKKIKPNNDWKRKNREILCSQLYGPELDSRKEFNWFNVIAYKLPINYIKNISQPAMAVFLISIFILTGGIISIFAAKNTKPGDSFYIAKIINEKTQLALTFNEKEKAKLGLEFASNRAQELSSVLAEVPVTEDEQVKKDEKVETLVMNLNNEIKTVKTRLTKISDKQIQIAKNEENGTAANNSETAVSEGEKNENDANNKIIFSANLEKEKKGIEYVEPTASTTAATTTNVNNAPQPGENTENILKQAQEKLNNGDYSGTLFELNKAEKVVDNLDKSNVVEENPTQSDGGKVLGEEEVSTSTQK